MQGPLDLKDTSMGPVSEERLKVAKTELEDLKAKTGWKEPVRSHVDDKDIKWRFGGAPDYTLANLAFLKGKTRNHPEVRARNIHTTLCVLVGTSRRRSAGRLTCLTLSSTKATACTTV